MYDIIVSEFSCVSDPDFARMVPPDFPFACLTSQLEYYLKKRQAYCKGTHEAAISLAATADGADTGGETVSLLSDHQCNTPDKTSPVGASILALA